LTGAEGVIEGKMSDFADFGSAFDRSVAEAQTKTQTPAKPAPVASIKSPENLLDFSCWDAAPQQPVQAPVQPVQPAASADIAQLLSITCNAQTMRDAQQQQQVEKQQEEEDSKRVINTTTDTQALKIHQFFLLEEEHATKPTPKLVDLNVEAAKKKQEDAFSAFQQKW
jgi:hypothetical protein